MNFIENYIEKNVYKRKDTIILPKLKRDNYICIDKEIEYRLLLNYSEISVMKDTMCYKNNLLSYLLYNTCGIIKYEPDSQYPFHASVPSTRGLHSSSVYVVEKIQKKLYMMKYDIYSNSLLKYIEIPDEISSKLEKYIEDNDLCLLVTMNLNKLGYLYGEFSYQLGYLDAGHVIGQLSILLGRVGIEHEIIYSIGEFQDTLNSILNINELSICAMIAHPKYMVEAEEYTYKKQIITEKVYFNNLLNLFDDSNVLYLENKKHFIKEYVDIYKQDRLLKSNDFFDILYNRTSSHNILGLTSNDNIIDLIGFNKEIIDQCFSLIFIEPKLGKVIEYKADSIKEIGNIENEKLSSLLLQYKEGMTIDTFGMLIIITCDLDEMYSKYETSYFNIMHLKAGMIAQYVSIYFSKQNCFTRPIKNINEVNIKNFFGKNAVYAICVGKSIYANLTIDMRRII